MRLFRTRPSRVVVTLVARTVFPGAWQYRGTYPLAGDWDIWQVVVCPDVDAAVNQYTAWGVRLATNVPTSSAEWDAAERLWHGDSEGSYDGDGFVVPNESNGWVEGPFRIQPRGRRLVVVLGHSGLGARTIAVTFVLQQV